MTTLVTTAGSASANSYASLAESNTYHETVRPDDEITWLEQAETTRERLLIMSSRLIDQHWEFIGYKKDNTQALQWPRQTVLQDGRWANATSFTYLDNDTIPQFLKDATAELARILVDIDTTADPDGAGFKQIAMAGMAVTFNERDRASQGVMRTSVYSFLRKYGSYRPSLNSSSPGVGFAKVIRQ
jgi:hypothetical protein